MSGLTRGPALVEYHGKSKSVNEKPRGVTGVTTFPPNPEYGGRRVVQFDSVENALLFVKRFPGGQFTLAEDLISVADQQMVGEVIDGVVGERIRALEAAVKTLQDAAEKTTRTTAKKDR